MYMYMYICVYACVYLHIHVCIRLYIYMYIYYATIISAFLEKRLWGLISWAILTYPIPQPEPCQTPSLHPLRPLICLCTITWLTCGCRLGPELMKCLCDIKIDFLVGFRSQKRSPSQLGGAAEVRLFDNISKYGKEGRQFANGLMSAGSLS